jgi:hypothetical protein
MRPICVKGKRISNFLVKTDKITYPMLDTKYLASIPLGQEFYMLIQRQKNNHYKLLKCLTVL